MQKIVPHLWFDKEAGAAAEFYTQTFPNSRVTLHQLIKYTPSGDAEQVAFSLNGYEFMAISAGPYFQINPSISFMVNFNPAIDESASENLDELWEKLSEGGEALMELGEYPFSSRYGWVKDKFGVTWQLILNGPDSEPRPYIVPSIMFIHDQAGRAEEARDFYLSVFEDAEAGTKFEYEPGTAPDDVSKVAYEDFQLLGQWFAAMDAGRDMHDFDLNEAVSLIVNCQTQAEIDELWTKLSAVPESEQCGWLKDKFGVSWQIVPTRLGEMMSEGNPDQVQRVTEAFLKMKKFDITELERAYQG
ncbi:MAG TPA: VOC family protein [Candidatus Saccharimonadales bacterium]|nr:VOC family protein [Candidatus Saccharimonadales bacterium]